MIPGYTDWLSKMSGAQKMDDHAVLGRWLSSDWGLRNTSLLSSLLYILSFGTWNSFWRKNPTMWFINNIVHQSEKEDPPKSPQINASQNIGKCVVHLFPFVCLMNFWPYFFHECPSSGMSWLAPLSIFFGSACSSLGPILPSLKHKATSIHIDNLHPSMY